MRTSAPSAFASSSVPCEPGMRSMSPKQVKITPGSWAIAMPSSTRPIGITQTGQPGPCTSSTFAGQQVVDAVLVDRVRVAAAHLHDLVVAARLDRREDLPGQRRGRARRRGTRRRTSCGRRQRATPSRRGRALVAAGDRLTSAISTVERAPPSSSQSASPRSASIPRTRMGTPSSPQVMQCAGRRRRPPLTRSRSP